MVILNTSLIAIITVHVINTVDLEVCVSLRLIN